MKITPRLLVSRSALLSLLAAALLAGCASGGMDKNQCVAADWRTIGYEDGLRGAPAERIGGHRAACAQHGVTPNLTAYLEGRDKGLQQYCEPKNGFRVGLNGGSYGNVCTGQAEAAFISAYRYGRDIFDARAELRRAQSQLRSAKENLTQTDSAMASATAELVQPQIPTDRRAYLASELVRLTQERGAILSRIDQLTAQTQQLQANVREVERRSPYPL